MATRRRYRKSIPTTVLMALVAALAAPPAMDHANSLRAALVDPALSAAIADPARSAPFVARDGARHPAEELTFLGLKPSMTVIELWPGRGYWTEILGPYLAPHGHYIVALPPPRDNDENKIIASWKSLVATQGERLGTITETTLGPGHFDLAPEGSADIILTFRNFHNWMEGGYAAQALDACLRALKPGGLFGIEEHRGSKSRAQDPRARDGYVREDYAIALIRKAGFKLIASSEINANPRDTKHWPKGVWTLPPTLALGDKDRDKYLAIGEADNFVLRFRKPRA